MLERLRLKFVAAMMGVATLLLCLLLFVVYHITAVNLKADNIRMMQSMDSFVTTRPFSPNAQQSDDRLHYFVLSRTGRNRLEVIGNTGFDLKDAQLVSQLFEAASSGGRGTGELKNYALRFYRLSDMRGETYIFSDISDEIATLNSLRQGCIVTGLVSMLLLFAICDLMVKWMIRPVEITWELQKEFVANASHELKTPLTVIMTNSELLHSSQCSHEEQTRLIEGISAMSIRMRQLVEGMLDLARVDSGIVKNMFERFCYSELVEQSLLPFEAVFF